MNGKLFSIISLLLILTFLVGCSGNGPTIPADLDRELISNNIVPVGVSDSFPDGLPAAGNGAVGLFNLHVDKSALTAELTPVRKSALTDVLEIVDITNFLRLAPCTDCVKIKSISLDTDGNFVVKIGIKHPFPAGDAFKPISGKNRADLHVFNVEGTIVSNLPGTSYPALGKTISGFRLLNADGYSDYLDASLEGIYPTEASAHPYILHFDDYSAGNFDPANPNGFQSVTTPPPSGNLVMAMGCDYDYKDYVFKIDSGSFDFIYAVGCTYAVSSASKNQRFNPEYRIPQHNKKAASEVSLVVVSNDLKGEDTLSNAQVEVHVVDISHGVSVGDGLDQMLSDSSVDNIMIEIPGVTTTPVTIAGNSSISGTGHDSSDPLVFQATITNAGGASEGTYTGLIKVRDTYAPGQNQSPLLNGMDGITRVSPIQNPLEGLFAISEFATYQVFTIDVASGNDNPVAVLISDPDPAEITQFQTVDFDATGSYDTDGSITLYEFDFVWDGLEANFAADVSNVTGLATSSQYSGTGAFTAGLRITDDLGATGYDSVTVNVAEISVIYVDDSNTSGIEDGTVQHPYNTIPEGLAAANSNEEVWVDDSSSIYTGPITLRAGITLKSVNWDNTDGSERATIRLTTNTPVVTGADEAVIDNFIISGGTLYGIYISGVDTTVRNCLVTQITGVSAVYGLYVMNSSGTIIENSEFYDINTTNNWPYNSHMAYLSNSPITISGCEFHQCTAAGNWPHMWGIRAVNCAPSGGNHLQIRNTKVYDMSTGGSWCDMFGIDIDTCNEAEIVNNIVYSLTAASYDHSTPHPGCHGILLYNSSDVDLINNTVYDIERTGYYGVIYGVRVDTCANLNARNNIVNRILKGASGYYQSAYGVSAPAGTTWEYSDVFNCSNGTYTGGIVPGVGCISVDPLFVNPGTDFHLAAGSPCINTGDPSINDPDSTRSDMGAYGGSGGDW